MFCILNHYNIGIILTVCLVVLHTLLFCADVFFKLKNNKKWKKYSKNTFVSKISLKRSMTLLKPFRIITSVNYWIISKLIYYRTLFTIFLHTYSLCSSCNSSAHTLRNLQTCIISSHLSVWDKTMTIQSLSSSTGYV